MPRVRVELPSLLVGVLGGVESLEVDVDTVRGALEAAVGSVTGLRLHVFDEDGGLRPHVLCFHNETNHRCLEDLDVSVVEGDTIRIYQAVSGG